MVKKKDDFSKVRHSKAVYALAVYGFIILFAAMIYPFLPIYDNRSAFQIGSVIFDGKFEESLIVIGTMLVHSIISLIVLIVMLVKIGRYQAGAGYCMYKFFRNALLVLFLIFTGLHYSGYFYFYLESIGFEYWLGICGAYMLGVIFAFLARLANNQLRPSPLKSFFYFTNILVCAGLIYFFWSARGKVNYTVFNHDYGYIGSFVDMLDYTKMDLAIFIYDYLLTLMLFKFLICFTHACMPINAPFSYMSYGAKRSKHSRISYVGAIFDLLIYATLIAIFGIFGLTKDMLLMFIPLVLVILKFCQIGGYNRKARKLKIEKRIPCSTIEYEKVDYRKKGFYYTNYKNESKPNMAVLSYNPIVTTEAVNAVVGNEVVEQSKRAVMFDSRKVWDVEQLKSYNLKLDFKDKTTIVKMGDDLHAMLNDHGVLIEKDQTQKVLAGILSSKVTFIRCEPNRELIKTFSDTISEFFAEEMFYDERLNPEFDGKGEISLEAVVEEKNKKEITEAKEEVAIANTESEAQALTTEQAEQTETEAKQEEQAEQTETEVKQEEKAEPVVQKLERITPIVCESEQEKKERLLKEEMELVTKERHSIACGMFVAHYIDNTFGMIFLNNSEQFELSESDSKIVSAVIFGEESVFVGNQRYCPENEIYSQGKIKVPDNVRLIVYINDHEETKLDKRWLKHSTIVELSLVKNQKANYEMQLDCGTSYTMINQSLEEAQETCYLTEDYWRKLDKLEEYLEKNTDLRFDNKYIRQIEKSITAFIACGMDRRQALDAVLSEKIIPIAATEREKILAVEEKDFETLLDELFGFENIPITKKVVDEYGLRK